MALRRQMIDFIRLNSIEELDEIGRIGDIPVVQKQPHSVDVRILVEMIDPSVLKVEARRMMP